MASIAPHTQASSSASTSSEALVRSAGLVILGAGAALAAYHIVKRPTLRRMALSGAMTLAGWSLADLWSRVAPLLAPSDDSRTALGGDAGVRVRRAVEVDRPIERVYAYWRELANLPRFMANLERVTESGNHSHWIATGPGDIRVEWDAEIINDVPNKLIAWRSLPGSQVTTAGSVNFDEARNGRGTRVTVALQYALPAGDVGAAVAAIFGRDPAMLIRQDLQRFKRHLESSAATREHVESA